MSAARPAASALLAVVMLAGASAAEPAASKTIRVRNDKQFRVAVSKLASSGGTIRLQPHFYRALRIGPRSERPLRIIGKPGVRIERVLFDRTKRVSLVRVRISPRTQHAVVEVNESQQIYPSDLFVTARGNAPLGVGDRVGLAVREDSPQHVHALRGSLGRVVELPHALPPHAARDRRGQLVPRLLRL